MTWPALYGKAHVDRVLAGSVAMNRLHHAYLFEGPLGTGKTYLAIRTAAALLCKDRGMYGVNRDKGGGIDPCGECRNCKRILTRNHPDLVWFDDLTIERGGSHVPVARLKQIPLEALHQLSATLSRRPVEGDRRAVVIRQVERMNTPTQNAFLKLLEEPPKGTLFLLTCVNTHQLLKTILSRCQRLPVRPLTDAQLAGALVTEGVGSAAAEELSRVADGRIGTALAQAGKAPPAGDSPPADTGGSAISTRPACSGWLDLLTGARGLTQAGEFSGRILATIQENLAREPVKPARETDLADDGDSDSDDDSENDEAPARGKAAAKTPKAKGANITANEAQRLAAQRVIGDLAYTWHRAWQLGQGAPDPAGEPPLYPPPSPALIERVRNTPLFLIHGWFEEAIAALQFNVRTELVLKALAVRLAR